MSSGEEGGIVVERALDLDSGDPHHHLDMPSIVSASGFSSDCMTAGFF